MKKEPNNKNVGNSDGFIKKLKNKFDGIVERYDEKRARRDIIFTETITPAPAEKKPTMVCGGIDIQLLLAVLALIVLGATMSFSASYVYAGEKYDDSMYFFKRYIFFALASIAFTAFFVAYFTPRLWKMLGVLAYAGSVVLLILVLLIGRSGGGAQRWIQIGPITIQPSEIAKMAVIMMLALYMSYYEKEIKSVHVFGGSVKHGVLMPGVIIGTIVALVMLEKHISGVIIIGVIGLAVMYMGGTHTKWIMLILGVIGGAALLLVLFFPYAQDRVTSWLNLEADMYGSGWQTLQGLYAIGSGGFFGRGLGYSNQKYGYVSEPQNDFVFTIVCEELGFVGAAIVMGLFAILVWRGFKIADRCPDKYLKLVAYGLTFKVALQALLNIAVVTNSIPNTGISLPFFSSGGTAIAVQIFEIGILLSISRYSAAKE